MASILSVWNDALRLCKTAPLASTTTSTGTVTPEGVQLADVWSGAVQNMLELAQWTFAKKSTSIAGSTANAGMGYPYGSSKPSDFVRLISIAASTAFYPPLEHFDEDKDRFYVSDPTIYIQHTSNSTSYGLNVSAWPETFAKALAGYLALQVAPQITSFGKEELDRVEMSFERRLARSMAKDAINQTSRVLSSSRESVFRGALRLLGFRPLQRFSDDAVARRFLGAMPKAEGDRGGEAVINQEAVDELTLRRMLDEAYDDAVAFVIEENLWNWAQKSVAIDSSSDVEPEFGFTFAFEKPSDWVRNVAIAGNDLFYPLLGAGDYLEEGGYWNANVDPLYVIYISDANDRGTDMNVWPRSVKMVLEAYLAKELAPYRALRLPAARIAQIEAGFTRTLRNAKARDVRDQAPSRPAPSRLASARAGYRRRWPDWQN